MPAADLKNFFCEQIWGNFGKYDCLKNLYNRAISVLNVITIFANFCFKIFLSQSKLVVKISGQFKFDSN